MLFGDVADDGEAETRSRCRSGVVGSMEALEDPFGVVDAGAVVAHDDPSVSERQFDRSVVGAELVGIAEIDTAIAALD